MSGMNAFVTRFRRAALPTALLLGTGLLVLPATSAEAVSPDVVVSEVYGGGGNSGATYNNDFIELYNTGTSTVDLSGWSVQYASSTGTTWQATELTGSIEAGGHFLVQEEAGTTPSAALPPPDDTGSINLSGTNGKVALVTSTTPLDCESDCTGATGVRDFVGYGTADDFEGTAAAPALTNTTSAQREAEGTDTDDNVADFTAATPVPENSGIEPEPVAIHEIQGSAHLSPLDGQAVVEVPGIVTQRTSNGFWMQDPAPDANDATSEGIFVFTSSAPPVGAAVGASVTVDGTVDEFRSGGADSTNLTTTEITGPTVDIVSSGNPLPAATVVGTGGRVPPSSVIDDDATGSVETSGSFDPATDGIDFYESLEGMRLQLDDPEVVGPTNSFGELPVVTDGAGLRTDRGGIVVRPADFNPERVILDALTGTMPAANVGDSLDGEVTGVLDYTFGNFKLYVAALPTVVPGGITRETSTPADADELAVATYNVENLSPADDQTKFDELATGIVDGLAAPDVVTLEEVQDNTGPTDDGVVAADETLDRLVAAIETAGGPSYDWRQIDPENDSDGGQPGGNIRVAFLFRTDRGLQFVDRPGGDATTPVEVAGTGADTHLSISPGRIQPENRAWIDSRKPLVGEFRWAGRTVFVIANHFASKGGDEPLFGRFQPPERVSEVQRHRQAEQVRRFADELLAADPQARVVVAGDLNDFEFSETASILVGSGADALTDLPRTLPADERYSYVFDGNSQVLDHLLLSRRLRNDGFQYDVVHTNAEFADQVSDHDPQVVQLSVDAADPTRLTMRVNPRTATFGDTVDLSGHLRSGDSGLEGYPVSVQARPAGTEGWSVVRNTTTVADGAWSVQVTPETTTDYRAVYGGGENLASRSQPHQVDLRPVVRARPGTRTLDEGEVLRVIGLVRPPGAASRADLQRQGPGGRWSTIASGVVRADGDFVVRWTAVRVGVQQLRVVTPAGTTFVQGRSDPFTVTVR